MIEEFKQKKDITESDIVFDCPNCRKSLAMDRRGAGLTIDCPGCNEPVRVPTPPDAVPETYKDLTEYADMEDLQQSLLSSRKKVDALTAQIAETAKKHEDFEAQRDKNAATINKLRSEFGHIQDALDNIYKFLQE